jgi:hypothetical protein
MALLEALRRAHISRPKQEIPFLNVVFELRLKRDFLFFVC